MKVKPTKTGDAVVLEVDRREALLEKASEAPAPSPFRVQRVLVPTDFSGCARKALQYAVPFAKLHGAALTLLYVVPTQYALSEYGGIDYASIEADLRVTGEKQLAELAESEVRRAVPVDTVVRTGSPAAEIVEAARTLPADIIVLSTHGRSGLPHVLVGSVAEHVVRRAPCPVLVVREKEHEFIPS